jgi:hypothetical protein
LSVVGGRLSVVGLTRRGPPTCRQRRELLHLAKENPRISRIPSHLRLRAKVGGPRRVSPTHLPFKNQKSKFIIHHSSFIIHHSSFIIHHSSIIPPTTPFQPCLISH